MAQAGIIGIDPGADWLYDAQMARPAGFCAKCGREIYAQGREVCEDCFEEGM